MTRKHDRVGAQVTKMVRAQITKIDDGADGGSGSFEALVAVFDNLDSQGDIVRPGAFGESIKARGGQPYGVVWSHQFYDLKAFLGEATAEETAEGLLYRGTFFDDDDAQKLRKLMRSGVIAEFSWSGKVLEGSWIDEEGVGPWNDGYYEIRKVDFWEAGPCFKGANPETELLSVKSAVDRLVTKEGRVLAQQYVDTLKSIHEELGGVIGAVDKAPVEDLLPEAPSDPIDVTPDESESEASPGDAESKNEALEDSGAFLLHKTRARLCLSDPGIRRNA